MTPEAIRARAKRERARGAVPAAVPRPPVSRVPASNRLSASSLVDPSVPVVRDMEAGVRSTSRILRGIGSLASLWFGDAANVPERDADECARSLVEAWPELLDYTGDAAKAVAVLTVVGVVGERVRAVRSSPRTKPAAPVSVVDAPVIDPAQIELAPVTDKVGWSR